MLPASFFERDPLTCARELIGTELVWGKCSGIVVETEAYLSQNDEACHCFVRPSTRAFLARNKPGAAYIYLNYGVHWMLNALTKSEQGSGFVLIRALEPTAGLQVMQRRRGVEDVRRLCSGPGKLTRALRITRADDERDLCADEMHCFREAREGAVEIVTDRRIGITKSADLPWRFTLRGSKFVSRGPKL
ncbi:MAG: DNA-3-methyladenine glycosylase [Chthoniobacterales bacterium]